MVPVVRSETVISNQHQLIVPSITDACCCLFSYMLMSISLPYYTSHSSHLLLPNTRLSFHHYPFSSCPILFICLANFLKLSHQPQIFLEIKSVLEYLPMKYHGPVSIYYCVNPELHHPFINCYLPR